MNKTVEVFPLRPEEDLLLRSATTTTRKTNTEGTKERSDVASATSLGPPSRRHVTPSKKKRNVKDENVSKRSLLLSAPATLLQSLHSRLLESKSEEDRKSPSQREIKGVKDNKVEAQVDETNLEKKSKIKNSSQKKKRSLIRRISSTQQNVLRCTPEREIDFALEPDQMSIGRLLLENTLPNDSTAFKIKTTMPDRYHVHPTMGIIAPGRWIEVQFIVRREEVASLLLRHDVAMRASDMKPDKFLVQSAVVEQADLSTEDEVKELAKLWATPQWRRKTMKVKLISNIFKKVLVSEDSNSSGNSSTNEKVDDLETKKQVKEISSKSHLDMDESKDKEYRKETDAEKEINPRNKYKEKLYASLEINNSDYDSGMAGDGEEPSPLINLQRKRPNRLRKRKSKFKKQDKTLHETTSGPKSLLKKKRADNSSTSLLQKPPLASPSPSSLDRKQLGFFSVEHKKRKSTLQHQKKEISLMYSPVGGRKTLPTFPGTMNLHNGQLLSQKSTKMIELRHRKALQCTPRDEIDFALDKEQTALGQLLLENTLTHASVAFKIKTTQPNRYLVRPALGIIMPGKWMEVQLIIRKSEVRNLLDQNAVDFNATPDKFLIQSAVIESQDFSTVDEVKELSELWTTPRWKRKTVKRKMISNFFRKTVVSDDSSSDSSNDTSHENDNSAFESLKGLPIKINELLDSSHSESLNQSEVSGKNKNKNRRKNSSRSITPEQSRSRSRSRASSRGSMSGGVERSLSSHERSWVQPAPFTWQRGQLIGQGKYGRVYVTTNIENGDVMAMKEVELPPIELATPGAAMTRPGELVALQQEISLMRSLSHPNIVQYLATEREPLPGGVKLSKRASSPQLPKKGAARDKRSPSPMSHGSLTCGWALRIFMEYVPGGSIYSLLKLRKNKGFPESVLRNYTKQILKGLRYLHTHGIAHRDIKGANILISNQGLVKLADFGASKSLRGLSPRNTSKRRSSSLTSNSNLNELGINVEGGFKSSKQRKRRQKEFDLPGYQNVPLGTPLWMAPEAIRLGTGMFAAPISNSPKHGERAVELLEQQISTHVDWDKADIWSVGCTLIEMASGEMPWHDKKFENPISAMFHIASSNTSPSTHYIDICEDAKSFLNLCFQQDPRNRPTASDLLKHAFVCDANEIIAPKELHCIEEKTKTFPKKNELKVNTEETGKTEETENSGKVESRKNRHESPRRGKSRDHSKSPRHYDPKLQQWRNSQSPQSINEKNERLLSSFTPTSMIEEEKPEPPIRQKNKRMLKKGYLKEKRPSSIKGKSFNVKSVKSPTRFMMSRMLSSRRGRRKKLQTPKSKRKKKKTKRRKLKFGFFSNSETSASERGDDGNSNSSSAYEISMSDSFLENLENSGRTREKKLISKPDDPPPIRTFSRSGRPVPLGDPPTKEEREIFEKKANEALAKQLGTGLVLQNDDKDKGMKSNVPRPPPLMTLFNTLPVVAGSLRRQRANLDYIERQAIAFGCIKGRDDVNARKALRRKPGKEAIPILSTLSNCRKALRNQYKDLRQVEKGSSRQDEERRRFRKIREKQLQNSLNDTDSSLNSQLSDTGSAYSHFSNSMSTVSHFDFLSISRRKIESKTNDFSAMPIPIAEVTNWEIGDDDTNQKIPKAEFADINDENETDTIRDFMLDQSSSTFALQHSNSNSNVEWGNRREGKDGVIVVGPDTNTPRYQGEVGIGAGEGLSDMTSIENANRSCQFDKLKAEADKDAAFDDLLCGSTDKNTDDFIKDRFFQFDGDVSSIGEGGGGDGSHALSVASTLDRKKKKKVRRKGKNHRRKGKKMRNRDKEKLRLEKIRQNETITELSLIEPKNEVEAKEKNIVEAELILENEEETKGEKSAAVKSLMKLWLSAAQENLAEQQRDNNIRDVAGWLNLLERRFLYALSIYQDIRRLKHLCKIATKKRLRYQQRFENRAKELKRILIDSKRSHGGGKSSFSRRLIKKRLKRVVKKLRRAKEIKDEFEKQAASTAAPCVRSALKTASDKLNYVGTICADLANDLATELATDNLEKTRQEFLKMHFIKKEKTKVRMCWQCGTKLAYSDGRFCESCGVAIPLRITSTVPIPPSEPCPPRKPLIKLAPGQSPPLPPGPPPPKPPRPTGKKPLQKNVVPPPPPPRAVFQPKPPCKPKPSSPPRAIFKPKPPSFPKPPPPPRAVFKPKPPPRAVFEPKPPSYPQPMMKTKKTENINEKEVLTSSSSSSNEEENEQIEIVTAAGSMAIPRLQFKNTDEISSPPLTPGGQNSLFAVALADYVAESELELTVRKGDLIRIIDRGDGNGWWKGELHHVVGYFPSTFVHIKFDLFTIDEADDGESISTINTARSANLGMSSSSIGMLSARSPRLGMNLRSPRSPWGELQTKKDLREPTKPPPSSPKEKKSLENLRPPSPPPF
eukprot:g3140.t1